MLTYPSSLSLYAPSPPRHRGTAARGLEAEGDAPGEADAMMLSEEDFSIGPSLYHFDQSIQKEEVDGGKAGIVIWGRPDLSPSIQPLRPEVEVHGSLPLMMMIFTSTPDY